MGIGTGTCCCDGGGGGPPDFDCHDSVSTTYTFGGYDLGVGNCMECPRCDIDYDLFDWIDPYVAGGSSIDLTFANGGTLHDDAGFHGTHTLDFDYSISNGFCSSGGLNNILAYKKLVQDTGYPKTFSGCPSCTSPDKTSETPYLQITAIWMVESSKVAHSIIPSNNLKINANYQYCDASKAQHNWSGTWDVSYDHSCTQIHNHERSTSTCNFFDAAKHNQPDITAVSVGHRDDEVFAPYSCSMTSRLLAKACTEWLGGNNPTTDFTAVLIRKEYITNIQTVVGTATVSGAWSGPNPTTGYWKCPDITFALTGNVNVLDTLIVVLYYESESLGTKGALLEQTACSARSVIAVAGETILMPGPYFRFSSALAGQTGLTTYHSIFAEHFFGKSLSRPAISYEVRNSGTGATVYSYPFSVRYDTYDPGGGNPLRHGIVNDEVIYGYNNTSGIGAISSIRADSGIQLANVIVDITHRCRCANLRNGRAWCYG